ncbi:MAG TPA: GPW/gp25 family protein [Thermoanaerobaculia bacterium]|nr:GPW/gp25 family protein [Thermoanaerobaculia bacterium]
MQLEFPFQLDGRGRVAETDEADHIRQLIEQVLFTAPGERVERPTFGAGLLRLIFAPASDELQAATRFLVQGQLQQWLGQLIELQAVELSFSANQLEITVVYLIRQSQRRVRNTFVNRRAA